MQQQLVRIKLLYRQALLHTEKSDEINLILLVQILDFTVESFLKLVIHHFPKPQKYNGPQSGYHCKIPHLESTPYSPKLDFYRAWDEVVGILRNPGNKISIVNLPMRRDMERLHEIRNDVQHKTAIPHPQDAQKYLLLVESFLKNSYQDIFGVDYDTISPLSLIKNPRIKEQLEKAHTALNTGDWNTAVIESAKGFHILLGLARTIFRGFFIDTLALRNQPQPIKYIVEHIKNLQDHLLITSCGIDYFQYLKYRLICPGVLQYGAGSYQVILRKDYSESEAKSVLNFVETQVLQFQASDMYQDLIETNP